jgi:hypothetical protein
VEPVAWGPCSPPFAGTVPPSPGRRGGAAAAREGAGRPDPPAGGRIGTAYGGGGRRGRRRGEGWMSVVSCVCGPGKGLEISRVNVLCQQPMGAAVGKEFV